MKLCRKCGEEKPANEFLPHRHACRSCRAKAAREHYAKPEAKARRLQRMEDWYAKNRERRRIYLKANQTRFTEYNRNYNHKKNYGISIQERDEILTEQGKCCAICGRVTPGKNGWATDHCHRSGIVRGVLCNRCNLMLGLAKDSLVTLERAANYIEGWDVVAQARVE